MQYLQYERPFCISVEVRTDTNFVSCLSEDPEQSCFQITSKNAQSSKNCEKVNYANQDHSASVYSA